MTLWLEIAGTFLLILGILFCVLPVIPGQILAFGAIALKYFFDTNRSETLPTVTIALLVALVVVSVLDFFAPAVMLKKAGGSKSGSRGALIGMLAGMLLTPVGMLLGMFLGAFFGEMLSDSSDTGRALRSSLMSFLGFFLSVGLKMIYVFVCAWYFFVC